MNRLIFFILLLDLLFSAHSTSAQWTAINGPYVANITALAKSGANLLAGTTDKGIFASNDGGNTWNPSNTGLGNPHVLCLALDSGDVYLGTDQGGIYKSVNNGATWTSSGSGLPTMPVIRALTVLGNTVYAAMYQGVYASYDNGASWNSMNNGLAGQTVLALEKSGTNLFCGTGSDGVYMSSDSGANWIPANTMLPSGITVFKIKELSGDLFISTTQGIYKSSNMAGSWLSSGSGIFPYASANDFAICGATLYAATPQGVYSSVNGGVGWTPIGLAENEMNALLCDAGNLFAGTNNQALYMYDGSTWNRKSDGMYGLAINDILFSGSEMYVSTAGNGMFKSSNSGNTWSIINTGLATNYNFNPNKLSTDGMNVYVSGQGVFRTSNGGNNWDNISNGPLGTIGTTKGIFYKDGILIVAENSSQIYYSTDSGDTYSIAQLVSPDKNVILKDQTFYYVGTAPSSGVYRTHDLSSAWVQKNNGLTDKHVITMALSGSYLYTGSEMSGVFVSTDSAENWVQKSIDTGSANWVRSLLAFGNTVIAGTNGGLYVSYNNGDNWQSVNTGLGNDIVISLAQNGNDVYAGTESGGIFVFYGLISGIEKKPFESDAFEIYPNPFDKELHIDINEPLDQANLVISDIHGKTVFRTKFSKLKTLTIPLELIPGIYTIQLISSEGNVVKKILKYR